MRSGLGLAVGVSVAAVGAAGAEAQGPLSWGEFREIDRVAPDASVVWADRPSGHGELFLPPGDGPHPVALVIHGGCWLSIADVGYMSHLARFLADQGWAVWVPEFRRIDQDDGEWPAILEDVAAAADHLRVLAPRHHLDLDRVVAFGHSSGGHLALWLASRHALPPDPESGAALRGAQPLPVQAVVGLAAISDLEEFEQRSDRGCGTEIVRRLVAGDAAGAPERLTLASPAERLPLGVPQAIAAGVLDTTVPLAHGEAWVRRATEAGDAATLLAVEQAGHFELVAPWTPSFEQMWSRIDSFLNALRLRPEQGSP